MNKSVTILLVLIVSNAGSFWFGTRISGEVSQLGAAKYEASIAARNLQYLNERKIENVRRHFERDLDYNLAWHADYIESNWKWIWPSINVNEEKTIVRAVKYRLEHNFPSPLVLDPKLENINGKTTDFMKEMKLKRDKVIEMYREKAYNKSLKKDADNKSSAS